MTLLRNDVGAAMMKVVTILALCALYVAPAQAQNQPLFATGPLTPGHALVLQQTGTPGSAVTRDGGPAIAGNFTEIGITNDGLPLCVRDKAGQHLLCLGANALGGGLISFNPIGNGTPTALNFNINGVTYGFPPTGVGTGNVVGPNVSVVGDVPCFNNTTGTLLSNGCPTARFLNPSTAALTSAGQLVKAVNNNASNTAASIYQMAFGPSPTVTTYDLLQAVAVVPTGSNLLATNAVAGYVLNQNVSIGAGTSQNATALFGVAVGAASSAATWGGNVLVTDNTSQAISSFHNQKLTGFEIDVNVWDTTTGVYGLLLAGASGQQPTVANAVLIAALDFTGANRAKWTTGFNAGSGCCQIGALIGTTAASGNNLSSMPLDFFVTNSSGSIIAYSLTGNPTNFFFSHNSGLPILWSFDDSVAFPANKAIFMNSDNVLSEDGSHNLLIGEMGISTITVGNTTAPVSLTGGVLAPQLPTQAHAGGNACLGYNASTKAIYVSSTITTC